MLAALMPSNRLVMRVILHTGLRVSDVLALRPADLAPRAWIVEQKTGKRRLVGFPADLLADLRKNAGEIWVFPGRNPEKHRSRQAVWCDVKRAAAAFRMPQNVGTHSGRKVYAVRLLRKYGDIAQVQRLLRHSSPAGGLTDFARVCTMMFREEAFSWFQNRLAPQSVVPRTPTKRVFCCGVCALFGSVERNKIKILLR